MTLSDSDFKGLRELQEAVGKRMKSGVVLYSGREILPFGKGLWAMPIQALWGYLSEGDRLLASLTTSPPDPPPLGRGTRP